MCGYVVGVRDRRNAAGNGWGKASCDITTQTCATVFVELLGLDVSFTMTRYNM
jgi:hypothetical protein